MQGNYPETVIEVLDDEMRFRPTTLRAVRAFASSKPWRGSLEKREEKFLRLNHDLASSCEIPEPDLRFGRIDGTSSRGSYYRPSAHGIVMTGKLSVVTYLHEFGHAMGKDEADACRWSVNLFRRCFPRQYSRLVHRGHTLVRAADVGRELSVARRIPA